MTHTYTFDVPKEKHDEFIKKLSAILEMEGVLVSTPEIERQRIMSMPLEELEKEIVI